MENLDAMTARLRVEGFHRCMMIESRCRRCGPARVFDIPSVVEEYTCPQCGVACEYTVLGYALTRHELPSLERVLA